MKFVGIKLLRSTTKTKKEEKKYKVGFAPFLHSLILSLSFLSEKYVFILG